MYWYMFTVFQDQKTADLEWFPRLRCMSLDMEDGPEQEQNEMKELQKNLAQTQVVIKTLASQLSELKDRVSGRLGSEFSQSATHSALAV